MVDYASENGLQVGMSTNGTLLNEKISERILNSKLDFLTLSLDGATEESYDKIRPGVRSILNLRWKNVEKNIFNFY